MIVLPTCSDGILNGAETDLDCGGGNCAACGNGKTCALARDCTSNLCENEICRKYTNMNHLKANLLLRNTKLFGSCKEWARN